MVAEREAGKIGIDLGPAEVAPNAENKPVNLIIVADLKTEQPAVGSSVRIKLAVRNRKIIVEPRVAVSEATMCADKESGPRKRDEWRGLERQLGRPG